MCGRFTLYSTPTRLASFFDAELAADVDPAGRPRWNVAPTTPILGLADPVPDGVGDGAARPVLARYRWGLVPPWAKDTGDGRLFNARGETVATKPSFRSAFAHRRMAVVADGFYEWQKTNRGVRKPYYFVRADGDPLAFAGLWEPARARAEGPGDGRAGREGSGEPLPTCTIITTTAGQDMSGIHDRMPVILAKDELARWLEPDGAEREELLALLRPVPKGTLARCPVDPRVGNVRNDDAGLIEPLATGAGRAPRASGPGE